MLLYECLDEMGNVCVRVDIDYARGLFNSAVIKFFLMESFFVVVHRDRYCITQVLHDLFFALNTVSTRLYNSTIRHCEALGAGDGLHIDCGERFISLPVTIHRWELCSLPVEAKQAFTRY